jgi:hypothetical protein
MAQPYDRSRAFLDLGDFVRVIGTEGEAAFFKVGNHEQMGNQTILMSDESQAVAVAAFSDPAPVGFGFNKPVQELRLVQVRPVIYPTPIGAGAPTPLNNVPPTVEVEWSSPKTRRRGGTDKRTTVTMNAIPNIVGGIDDGRIPANQIRNIGDSNEVYDIWVMHGFEPAFRVLNGSISPLGGGAALPLQFIWYVANEGRRYVLGKPGPEELIGLKSGKIPYRSISLGGITEIEQEE